MPVKRDVTGLMENRDQEAKLSRYKDAAMLKLLKESLHGET